VKGNKHNMKLLIPQMSPITRLKAKIGALYKP